MTNFNDIENKFKETLNDHSPQQGLSADAMWQNIDAELNKKSRAKVVWWFGLALLLLASIGVAYYVSDGTQSNATKQTSALSETSTSPVTPSVVSSHPRSQVNASIPASLPAALPSATSSSLQISSRATTDPVVERNESQVQNLLDQPQASTHLQANQVQDLPELNGKNWYALQAPVQPFLCCSSQLTDSLEHDKILLLKLPTCGVELAAGTNYMLVSNEANTQHAVLPGLQLQAGITKRFNKFYLSSQIGWSQSRYVFNYNRSYQSNYSYNQIPLGVVLDQNGNVVSTTYGDSTVTATFTRKVRSINHYQSAYFNFLVGKEWNFNRWKLGAALGPKLLYTYQQQGEYIGINDMPSGKITEASNGLKSFAFIPTVQLNFSRTLSSSWNMGIGVNASFGYPKLWQTYGKTGFVQLPVMLRLERQF